MAFGVGSEVGGGIADVIQGRSSSTELSVEEARERVSENPRDAEALRDLSSALQREGRPAEAVGPLSRYLQLKPGDENALRELASVHVAKATRLRNEAAEIQAEAQVVAFATPFEPAETTKLGQALEPSAIRDEIINDAQLRIQEKFGEIQSAYADAQRAYRRLARLVPQDAQVQLQLADASVNANDTQSALAAYRRFLELAPDDPTAPLVREEVKRLERESAPAGS